MGTEKRKRRPSKSALVRKAIEKFGERIDQGDVKPSMGDFIRLLQLEEELKPERPRDVKVTWVEPKEEEEGPAPGK